MIFYNIPNKYAWASRDLDLDGDRVVAEFMYNSISDRWYVRIGGKIWKKLIKGNILFENEKGFLTVDGAGLPTRTGVDSFSLVWVNEGDIAEWKSLAATTD